MKKNIPDKPLDELVEKFRNGRAEAGVPDIIRENWRSIACMTCGACCCSSVVPISEEDFEAFYGRLETAMDREAFARKFLADPDTAAPIYTIETPRHGGKCMFLGKRAHFECAAWEARPDVCRGFFCWEMTNFEKWMNGEEQESFALEADWMENFTALLEKLMADSPLTFFPVEMGRYLRILASDNLPSAFEAAPEKYTAKRAGK